MDAKCLTPEQREQLHHRVERRRDYLVKLVARMDAVAFPAEDPVRVAAVEARDKVQAVLKALDAAEPVVPILAHYGPSAYRAVEGAGHEDGAPTVEGEAEGEMVAVIPEADPLPSRVESANSFCRSALHATQRQSFSSQARARSTRDPACDRTRPSWSFPTEFR